MNAIWGIWDDVDSLSPEKCSEFFRKSLISSEFDDFFFWSNTFLALGAGSQSKFDTGSSDTKNGGCDRTGIVVIADAFLTNRKELIRQLKPGHSFTPINDTDLIGLAYKKWGTDCVEHLIGGFAFAVYDSREKSLFCARDHMGVCPFFFHDDGERFLFAGKPTDILDSFGIERTLNSARLIERLDPSTEKYFFGQTWFENVYALEAGETITVKKNSRIRRKYWRPGRTFDLAHVSDEHIFEEFTELFSRALGGYLDSGNNVTALLSGGLDSSSVVAVAAKLLEQQNRVLDVFAAVLPESAPKTITDEKYYIDQFKSLPNVNINYISDPKLGPFDNLDALFSVYDSPEVTSRHYLYSEFKERAFATRSDVILGGEFGELSGTSDAEGYFTELFLSFRIKELWSTLRTLSNVSGESIAYNIRANTISPLVPERLRRWRRNFSGVEDSNLQFDPFTREFAEDLRVIQAKKGFTGGPVLKRTPWSHSLNEQYRQELVQNRSARIVGEFGNPNVTLRYPWLDKRLLEYGLSIPGRCKIRDGYRRYLMRRGLDNVLPKENQWRITTSPFSPDYHIRYNKQKQGVTEFLSSIGESSPIRRIIDIPKLEILLNKTIGENSKRNSHLETIEREFVPSAVYLVHFLRKFPEFQN